MHILHKSLYNDTEKLEPNKGQRGLLCSNNESLRCPLLGLEGSLSKNTLEALDELGGVLERIQNRVIREGYKLTDKNIFEKI